MNRLVAQDLLKEGYYFGTKQEQIDSDEVVKKIRYREVHPKYWWIYQTPRWLGKIVYVIICFKKELMS